MKIIIRKILADIETSDNLIREIKNKKLENSLYDQYNKMTYGPPSEWKDKVNEILSKLLGRDIKLKTNSLNKIITKFVS